MAFGLDSTGFTRKRLNDIISALKTRAEEEFGDQVTTDPDSVFGQLIAVFSNELAAVWEAVQEAYDAYRPDAAEGVALDEVADLNGLVRLAATPTEVTALLGGEISTTIPAGSLASVDPTDAQFELTTEVTLSTASVARFDATPAGTDGTYTITINGTAFSHSSSGETVQQIIDALEALVDAGDEPVTFIDNLDGTFRIESDDLSEEFSLSITANLTVDEVFRVSSWEAVDTGPTPAPADTLTQIDTPTSGWNSITNPAEGSLGTNVETDTAFRLRRRESVSKPGAGTVAAITSNLRNITGVTDAFVVENRGITTDSEGRPAKSFEAVVTGGDNQAIADTIWERKPAGIETHGDISVTVTDLFGDAQVVNFSRPTDVWVHLDIEYTLYDEESFPLDGEQQIKDAVVAYGNTLDINDDVIIQRLLGPIFSAVSGIESLTIQVATSAAADDPPGAFSSSNLEVDSTSVARFDVSRVTVDLA